MGTHGDSVLMIVAWAVGSFFLALFLIFGLFGGLLLGVLLIPLILVLLPVVMIVAAFKGAPASATTADEHAIAESLAPEELEALISTALAPVLATVVDAEGTCPMKRTFRVREAWTLNGKWSGAELCPHAEKLLTMSAAQLRSGEIQDGELRQCLGEGHRVVFQLRKGQSREVIPSA
jgi:hypothetical protein